MIHHKPEPPLHIADERYRTALVGPLVRFRGGQQLPVPQAPPSNTGDPRYNMCVDHHLACDCREAELNETATEYGAILREIDEQLSALIDGHATNVYVDSVERTDLQCKCAGCVVARIARQGIRYPSNLRDVRLETTRGHW